MNKIKFTKTEESRAGKLFLFLDFEGGDADTSHPEEVEFEKFGYADYKEHLPEIEEALKKYTQLSHILDVNHKDSIEGDDAYDEVLEKYGEEIAGLYENVPGDPQTQGDTKCSLSNISLIGYDEKGTQYSSHLFIS